MKLLPTRDCSILLRKSLTVLTTTRRFSSTLDGGSLQAKTVPAALERYLGQPTPYTHKHLLQPGEITPGITQDEYKNRRYQLMSSIKQSRDGRYDNHAVVVLSSSRKYMSNNIQYPFRQNTNFLYLCGFQEPDSALVLENIPGTDLPEHKSILFVEKRDQHDELWGGPSTGIDGALEFIGVDEAYNVKSFSEVLDKISHRKNLMVWYDFFQSVGTSDAFHGDVTSRLITPCKARMGNSVNILEQTMHSMRVIKSSAECKLMQKSVSIASEAFKEVMKFSCPGINESALYARFDYETRIRGADFLAYIPVVAGGERAKTIHYTNNNQIIDGGDMVLMDAGCESHGYASDITRTWPVNGKFTSPQADLYDAILSLQKDCIDMCRVGVTLDQIWTFMLTALGKRLQNLGILSTNMSSIDLYKAAQKYCPHHVGHYLGMDVHDCPRVSNSTQLQPGMVITIEPGIYIPLTNLSASARYRGIGIRIEDNILITDDGPINLSEECPKEMEDIEALMAR